MIFVTGCARSGTSLTAKLLKMHGCNLGDEINVLYENIGVREYVLKPYLKSLHADPLGQRGFPELDELTPLPDLREKIDRIIGTREPRAYKDAKLTFVWPVFRDVFPDAKWILVRRDRERIIDSCLNAAFMFSYSDRLGWGHWIDQHEQRFPRMREELALIEFWPDQVVHDPDAFRMVAKFCGLTYDKGATVKAVNTKQWHSG